MTDSRIKSRHNLIEPFRGSKAESLDLDIVQFLRQSVAEPGLTVPHPGLRDRDFWQRQVHALTQQMNDVDTQLVTRMRKRS